MTILAMDINEIRHRNVRYLIHLLEVEAFRNGHNRVGGGQTMLAEKLGKSTAQVNHFASPKPTKNVGNKLAREIEQAFGKEVGYLDTQNWRPVALNWREVMERNEAGRNPVVPAYEIEAVEDAEGFDPEQEVMVDSVDVEVSAGNGTIVPEFVATKYRQRYTLRWFQEQGAKPDRVKIMAVRGESMEPTLYSKDRVAINLDATSIETGRVYAVIMAGEARVKRLFRHGDGQSVRVVSDNPDKLRYPDEIVDLDPTTFLVLGKVIERKGSGGL